MGRRHGRLVVISDHARHSPGPTWRLRSRCFPEQRFDLTSQFVAKRCRTFSGWHALSQSRTTVRPRERRSASRRLKNEDDLNTGQRSLANRVRVDSPPHFTSHVRHALPKCRSNVYTRLHANVLHTTYDIYEFLVPDIDHLCISQESEVCNAHHRVPRDHLGWLTN